MTVVDAHAHVIVPGLGAEVHWDDRGQVVELGGKAIRAAVREFVDLDRILVVPDEDRRRTSAVARGTRRETRQLVEEEVVPTRPGDR